MRLILNGQLHDSSSIEIPVHNRQLNYGDGLFETIAFKNGRLPFFDQHYDRLERGCKMLGIDLSPDTPELLLHNCLEVLNQNDLENGRLKMLLWRAGTGLYTPESSSFEYLIRASATGKPALTRDKIKFYDAIPNYYHLMSGFKSTSSMNYIHAGLFRKQHKLEDVIILDINGKISETLHSNIFWSIDKRIYTPSLKSGCIEGTARARIIKYLSKNGSVCTEGLFTPQELLRADFIFICNALYIADISQIENHRFKNGQQFTNQLREAIY